jgi:hypothetical protein
MEHVLNHPVIAIKSERALEHDCGAAHHAGLHPVVLFVPEIDIGSDKVSAAPGTRVTRTAHNFDIIAGVAGGDMVDNRSRCRRLFDAPQHMHEHALSRPAPANDTDDFPFRDFKRNIIENFPVIKIHTDITDADKWRDHGIFAPVILSAGGFFFHNWFACRMVCTGVAKRMLPAGSPPTPDNPPAL